MPRVALTDEQRAQHEMDDLCRGILEAIEYTFVVKKKLTRGETAAALNIHPNTWTKWRAHNLSDGGSFRDVALALRKAGYQIKIEAR